MTVRVRFAPSPTGYLHIGGARTALFNWMFARSQGGKFIIRIEDTDQKRFVEGATQYILDSLAWLGLDWDEGPDLGGPFAPYYQSQRADLYKKWSDWLIAEDHAYKCFCTEDDIAFMRQKQQEQKSYAGYDRRCRNLSIDEVARREAAGREYVVRLKMPLSGDTTFQDMVRGDITYANSQINDEVLLKSDGLPTYHLANVIDDHFMEITHIIRGDEWINSAPMHIQLYKAFGWKLPIYAHLSLVLNPDGKGKLSKRSSGMYEGQQVLVKVAEFKEAGYLPEAVLNFLANVGWSFGDDQEIFTIEEAIARFDLATINPAPARLPYSKLDWLNGQYIQKLTPEALADALYPFIVKAGYEIDKAQLLLVVPALNTRLKRLPEAIDFLQFLLAPPPFAFAKEDLLHSKMDEEAAAAAYQKALDFVEQTEVFDLESIRAAIFAIGEGATSNGKAGPFLGKMRLAMTGQKVSPPLFESMAAMGRERCAELLREITALFA